MVKELVDIAITLHIVVYSSIHWRIYSGYFVMFIDRYVQIHLPLYQYFNMKLLQMMSYER